MVMVSSDEAWAAELMVEAAVAVAFVEAGGEPLGRGRLRPEGCCGEGTGVLGSECIIGSQWSRDVAFSTFEWRREAQYSHVMYVLEIARGSRSVAVAGGGLCFGPTYELNATYVRCDTFWLFWRSCATPSGFFGDGRKLDLSGDGMKQTDDKPALGM